MLSGLTVGLTFRMHWKHSDALVYAHFLQSQLTITSNPAWAFCEYRLSMEEDGCHRVVHVNGYGAVADSFAASFEQQFAMASPPYYQVVDLCIHEVSLC